MDSAKYNSFVTTSSKLFIFSCIFAVSLAVFAEPDGERSEGKKRHERPKFSALDLDGNGSIELSEFKQKPLRQAARQTPNHEAIFGHIDVNGDGLITEEEFVNHKPPRRKKHRATGEGDE